MRPFVLIISTLLTACTPAPDSAVDDSGSPELSPQLVMGEAWNPVDGSFGRVLVRDEGFLLGFVSMGNEHLLRGYDESWQSTGELHTLAEPGDRQPDMILVDGLGGMLHGLLGKDGDGPGTTLRLLDDANSEIASSGNLLETDEERSLDPSLAVSGERAWLGTEYRQDGAGWEDNIAPSAELERGLLLRELDADLAVEATHTLTATIPGAEPPGQFWGLGTAQLRDADRHWVFAAAASGATEHFAEGESAGTRRIWALEYDNDLTFIAAHGPLTPEDEDSYWCTAVARMGEHTLLAHTFRRPEDGPVLGPPAPDSGHIALLLLDADFAVLDRVEVTAYRSDDIAAGMGGHRAGLAVEGERAWLSWDGPAEVWVQELSLGWE